MPTCSRIVSAFCSMSATPSSESTSNGVSVLRDERDPLGHSMQARGLASFAASTSTAARCLVAHGVLLSGARWSPWSRARRVAGGDRRPRPSPDERGTGRSTASARRGNGSRSVWDAHRVHEMLLEPRLDGGLELLHPAHDPLDLGARGTVQQGDPGAGAGGVAGAGDVGRVAVGHQTRAPGRGAGRCAPRTRRRGGPGRRSRCRRHP